jgi:hypothetical protein
MQLHSWQLLRSCPTELHCQYQTVLFDTDNAEEYVQLSYAKT